MLAMPKKRPGRLKAVEHPEIATVPTRRGADRELDPVHDDGQVTASGLRLPQLVGHEIERQPCVPPRPTKLFRRYFDKVQQVRPIEFGGQCRYVGKADTKLPGIAPERRRERGWNGWHVRG